MVVGAVGVIGDGVYGFDTEYTDNDRDVEEVIALAATTGFEPAPEIVRLAGENPFRVLARFPTWAALERALAHLKKTTGRTPSDPGAPYFVLRDPVQQFHRFLVAGVAEQQRHPV